MINIKTHLGPTVKSRDIDFNSIISKYGYNDLVGLNILFINMPLRESAKPNAPPQGPALLAARLRQYGANPIILDLNAYRIPTTKEGNFRMLTLKEAEDLLLGYLSKGLDNFRGIIS